MSTGASAGATATQRLAAWGIGLAPADVPAGVRHAAARHLLDGVGLTVIGRRSGAAAPSLLVARSLGGPPQARVLGERTFLSAPAAAMADAALVHAIDYDDTHAGGLVHATAVVLPAAFTVGQRTGASGLDVLTAAVFGYEVVCRIAMASPHGFHARGLHATQIGGVFSSAAVTARLDGCDVATTVDALGIAGSSAGGLLEFLTTGASTKMLHPGSSSLNGQLAAALAAAGATGPETVLEGPHGVYAALSARDADVAGITAGLGERWETTRIGIKPYPSCQLMHVSLDATRPLLARIPSPGSIREIVAHVHPDSAPTVCEPAERKVAPRSSYDAKFSLPWSVAALITDGEISVGTYDLDSVLRPEVAALAAKVRTVLTDGTGAGGTKLVAADAPGRVEITLEDGSVLVGEVALSTGGPENPMDDDALLAKFFGNVGGESAEARELADRLLGLAAEPDLVRIHDLAADVVGTDDPTDK